MNTIESYCPAVLCNPELSYPKFPYDPPEHYPEFKFKSHINSSNKLYPAIRNLLSNLMLDKEHETTREWNPFGDFIKPEMSVIIKPNWVLNYNPIDISIESLITHSSLIRTMIDYILIALNYKGKITIADAPLQMCDFDNLIHKNRTSDLVNLYQSKFPEVIFSIVDFRKTIFKGGRSKVLFKSEQSSREGDPQGYTLVDLNKASLLCDLDDRSDRFRVTCYDHNLLYQHHNREKHEYLVANSFLQADAIINLPKMKTHKKAGLTGALKNLVGINGHKEYLPHHIIGSFVEGGDQYLYPSRIKKIYNKMYDKYWSSHNSSKFEGIKLALLSKAIRTCASDDNLEGSWFGNKTIPRTTVDLNNIAYYYDTINKKLTDKIQRPAFHLLDGIVAGEGSGPLKPEARNVGVLIGGFNPVMVDSAMAKLMGYNPIRINTLLYAQFHLKSKLLKSIPYNNFDNIIFENKFCSHNVLSNLKFKKPKFWEQSDSV